VAIDEDIPPNEYLIIHPTPGTTGGTLSLVKRENDANSDARTIKRTKPRWIHVGALFHAVVDADKASIPYELNFT
jgi:hypothetical protein